MRLLLDEMYPTAIADQLRRRGHEVEAVTARADLRSLEDSEVFAMAQAERRAVVTENIGDFSRIADSAEERGQPHHGLILIDPVKFPRGNRRMIGHLVTQLDLLLKERPGENPTSLRHWL